MKNIKKTLVVLILCSFIMGTIPVSAVTPEDNDLFQKPENKIQGEYVLGEIIVKFTPGTSDKARSDFKSKYNVRSMEKLLKMDQSVNEKSIMNPFIKHGLDRLYLMRMSENVDVIKIVQAFNKNPNVEYAEPNYIVHIDTIPNDLSSSLWGLHNTGQTGGTPDADIDAPEAWDIQTGNANVVIAVIDTGVDYDHEDITANMWTNPEEIPNNGIDDDNNGFVDDVYGWDFYNDDNNPSDDHGHGTHCSGTIAAVGNNSVGIVGVNWETKIMALKFLGADGSGSTWDAIDAIAYVTMIKESGIPVIAMSNSWGGGGDLQALEDAISAANNAGILFVAAAGNSYINNDISPHYPSSYDVPNVIAVAATDHNDNLASFSNYGATSVDLAAPGVSILSTTPNNGYSSFSGTSMATPHVAGVAALIKATTSPDYTHLQIKDLILSSVDPIESLSEKMVSGGRLNAYNALLSAISEKGRVSLDKDVYTAPDTVKVTVFDSDLDISSSPDNTTVEVVSNLTGDAESITLIETGSNTKTFRGFVTLVVETPNSGELQVTIGDTITATYIDENDGTGLATVTDTAIIDTQSPIITAVGSSPSGTQATITWTTDEFSDSVVRYGTSPESLTLKAYHATMNSWHSVRLFGLIPDTLYYFDVESTDEAGNTATDNNSGSHYQFTTLPVPPILLVDDDEGDTYEAYFTGSLDDNGYVYDVWDVHSLGDSPTTSDMSHYSVVIWNTGYDYSQLTSGLTTEEQSSISGYLDGGGKIFISGQDILWNGVSSEFQTNYLHVASYANDTQTTTATGVSGDPISDGMDLVLSYLFTNFADSIEPDASAAGIFTTNVAGDIYGYSALCYPNSSSSTFRLVFFAFPFEAISSTASDPNNQKTVMNNVITWLQDAPTNQPPVAYDDAYSTDEDTTLNVSAPGVLANDQDPDSDPLIIASYTQPTNGSVTLNTGGSLTYKPYADYCGSDNFTYTVSDGNSGTDTATVTITVTCVNDPPVAVDDSTTTQEDTPVTIDVAANDTDVDGNLNLSSATVESGPINGTVINNFDGTFNYTPNPDFNGQDSFEYQICDTDGLCDTGTVTIIVTEANPTMHIASIDVSFTSEKKAGPNIFGYTTAVVTIEDENSNLVPNATVSGHWSGATSDIDSDITDNFGNVSLYSDTAKVRSGDIFTFTVDDVKHSDFTYNATVSVITNNSTSAN